MKFFLLFLTLLLLVACTDRQVANDEENSSPSDEKSIEEDNKPTNSNSKDELLEPTVDFKKYFKPAASTATFLGEGNEYASYTVKTKWLSDKYVSNVVDNGGATVLDIYRIEDTKIVKVYNKVVDTLPDQFEYPDVHILDSLPVIETYLSSPIKVGTTFGKWKIVETNVTLQTPFKLFKQVFVIEEVSEDYTNRKYFVEGYGEIKSESIMETENGEQYIVSSTLENISKQ